MEQVGTVRTHRGGGKLGFGQNSWPFVKLTITDRAISMRTILEDVTLRRESIRSITLQRHGLNHRFIFSHDDPDVDKGVEFWSFSPKPVVASLESLGYSVSVAANRKWWC